MYNDFGNRYGLNCFVLGLPCILPSSNGFKIDDIKTILYDWNGQKLASNIYSYSHLIGIWMHQTGIWVSSIKTCQRGKHLIFPILVIDCNKTFLKVHIFWEGHKIFGKSSPNFWPQYIQSKVRWIFHKILWPSQNIWTLTDCNFYNCLSQKLYVTRNQALRAWS